MDLTDGLSVFQLTQVLSIKPESIEQLDLLFYSFLTPR